MDLSLFMTALYVTPIQMTGEQQKVYYGSGLQLTKTLLLYLLNVQLISLFTKKYNYKLKLYSQFSRK